MRLMYDFEIAPAFFPAGYSIRRRDKHGYPLQITGMVGTAIYEKILISFGCACDDDK
jgi:hypothetical protein